MHDEREVLNTYADPYLPGEVCGALKAKYTRSELARLLGRSERMVAYWWNRKKPCKGPAVALCRELAEMAGQDERLK